MEMDIFFSGEKRVDTAFKGFTVRTDQTTKNGGRESHPTPFDLFLSSIGACTGYYVLAFCHERKIPIEDIRLTLRVERDEEKKMLGKILIDIHLPPAFPEKYRKAVVKAADQCSVKKHIFDPPEITVTAR
jgi:putative redox protein